MVDGVTRLSDDSRHALGGADPVEVLDSVQQRLFVVGLQLHNLKRAMLDVRAIDRLDEIEQEIDDLVQEVRDHAQQWRIST